MPLAALTSTTDHLSEQKRSMKQCYIIIYSMEMKGLSTLLLRVPAHVGVKLDILVEKKR